MNLGSLWRSRTAWSIAVYLGPRLVLPPRGRPDVLLRSNRAFRSPAAPHTRADPFLFARNGRLYLFYETQVADDYGRIAVDEIEGGALRRICTVLAEPFHLSNPAVFADGDTIYMMPESHGAGQLRLYRFDAFPHSPTLVRILLEGEYVDPSPVLVGGIWYIFATSARGLELFLTDDLESGTLRAHPCSPVTDDPQFHRCGGMPFVIDGQLVRPAQNGANGYGENLSLLAISEISPDAYREEPIAIDMLRRDQGWNLGGSHHVSVCAFGDGVAVAIDGQARDFWHHKPLIRAWMLATGRKRR